MSLPRYPEYKDSRLAWLGELPAHWAAKPLKAAASINDDALPETTRPDFELSYVDIGSVSLGAGIERTEEFVFSAAPSRARRLVRDGDVIVSTVRTYLRAIAPIVRPPENLVVSTGFAVVRSRNLMDSGFAKYVLQSQQFVDQVISRSTGVSYPAINASDLARIELPCPPKEEQSVIARFLDRETAKIDTLIAEQEKLLALLAEKRQATISHAVTRGLNPNAPTKDSGIPWLGEVPAHWSTGVLVRIADRVVVGIAEAATHAYRDDGVAILRSTNIRAGRIEGEILHVAPEFAAERGSKLIGAGDLVTVRTGNPGVTTVVPLELDQCQCFTMLITTLMEGNSPHYYCYWMNSESARRYFHLEGWGSAQLNISVPILKALPVVIPPFPEQEGIVKFLDDEVARVDQLASQAEFFVELLKERRSALISAAVTGKIDVREISEAVTA